MANLIHMLFAGLLGGSVLLLVLNRAHARQVTRLFALVKVEASGAAVAVRGEPSALIRKLLPRTVQRNLRQLGLNPRMFELGLGGVGLLFLGIGVHAFAGLAAAAGAVAAVVLIGWATLNILAGRRLAKLAALLPGFLDRVRQLLVVGNSLPMAFARAVQGSQPLLAQFFEPAVRRIHNGAGFAESIRQSADDSDLHEMRLFAATVAANTRFGGSMSHSLNNLVLYLRKRASIERELRSSTAQIRVSAWVLGLLPLLVATLIVVQNPGYGAWFFDHPDGKKLLIYCLASQGVGALVMRLIVRTRF